MRYAITSDVHANLQAWNAVLLDIRSSNVDRVICLGDIVGYGPNPREVLESVHSSVDHIVMGNHDAALCGVMDESLFNDNARAVLDWSRDELNQEAITFLSNLPLVLVGDGFRCTHAEFSNPSHFDYILEAEDALPSWSTTSEKMLFVGHTHLPGIYVMGDSGTPHIVQPQDFGMETDKRYLINVGSVGQPRDGDLRASYCIFDDATGAVYWRRIPFDVDAFQAAIEQRGLPAASAAFTRHDPRDGMAPLRDMVDFKPAQNEAQAASTVVVEQNLADLHRKVRRWKSLFVVLSICLALILAAGGFIAWRLGTRGLVIESRRTNAINATTFVAGSNVLDLPTEASESNAALDNWTIELGNRRKQTARAAEIDNESMGFILESDAPDAELRLSSGPIHVTPGRRFQVELWSRTTDGYSGSLAVEVTIDRAEAGKPAQVSKQVVKEPNERRHGGWLAARESFRVPAGARMLRVHINGTFSGRIEIRNVALSRR